ncbi:MAG TPA: LpxD N-terminal domain-containing protein, partial [Candidatus Acidoferrales bacterium]|nr:LpxD N-terminal domain-containing protein [Candidatus Acidoferrales bacterium]
MKLSDIAKHLDCELRGDGNVDIRGLAPIDSAEPSDLTFVANPRYRAHLRTTKAAAAIVATAEEDVTLPTLRTADPYAAFARAIDL